MQLAALAGACGGVWRSLPSVGVWGGGGGCRFCDDAFDRNLASVAVEMFFVNLL
jgi:hypothetical protein